MTQTWLHSIDDWTHTVASRGAQENPFPPLKGAMKMQRLIVEVVEVVDRVLMGEVRGNAWFSLFDEAGMVKLLKGMSRSGRDNFFVES